jgi:hypothetical protein
MRLVLRGKIRMCKRQPDWGYLKDNCVLTGTLPGRAASPIEPIEDGPYAGSGTAYVSS